MWHYGTTIGCDSLLVLNVLMSALNKSVFVNRLPSGAQRGQRRMSDALELGL